MQEFRMKLINLFSKFGKFILLHTFLFERNNESPIRKMQQSFQLHMVSKFNKITQTSSRPSTKPSIYNSHLFPMRSKQKFMTCRIKNANQFLYFIPFHPRSSNSLLLTFHFYLHEKFR